jgi:hypothetical protein
MIKPLEAPIEIYTGLWISSSKILSSHEWLKQKNINCILDCNKYFENGNNSSSEICGNYYYPEKIHKFSEKCSTAIYSNLFSDMNNVLIVCETGKRISIIIVIYFLIKHTGISLERSIRLVLDKIEIVIEPAILDLINKLDITTHQ